MNELIILAKFDYDGKTYLITLTNKKIVFYRYNKKYLVRNYQMLK